MASERAVGSRPVPCLAACPGWAWEAEALWRKGVGKRRVASLLQGHLPPKPLRAQWLQTHGAALPSRPPPPTTQDSALCLPFSSPHEAKSPPFPTSCPPKREGISRCFNHSLSFNPLGHPVEVPFSAPFQTKRRQDSEKHNHLPNRRRAKVKFKPRLAQLQIPASFLSLPPSLKAVGCQKWD